MASFDYRLNPRYATDYCCSKGGLVDKIICDLNKTPDSSQRPPPSCAKCGNPVDGPYCRGCALLRKKFKEDLFTYCVENGIFQDLQDTSESSNDNTNVVNAPQEPFVLLNSRNELLNSRNELLNSQNKLMEQMTSICDMVGQYMQKKEEEKRIAEDQAAKDRYWKIPICYDDDDDEESCIPLKDIIIYGLPPCVAITSDSPKTDSFIMEDEHLSTISETESDEFIKSSVENLVPTPSESEDASNGQCDLPVCDDFPKSHLVTFSNPLFDIDDDCTSSDDESFSEEDIESLLDEFAGELTLLKSIPSGIDDDNLDPECEIHLVERLLYDNSSPRPPEDSNSDVSDAITESFSPSPIPIEDSDSLMEKIDLFLTPDDSMPPGIETDDYDSEGDIPFFEELLTNDSLSLPEHESFHFESDYDPSSLRPPTKPPDNDEIEPDTGLLTTKVVGDIFEHYVLIPRLLPTQPILHMDFDFIPSNGLGSDHDVSSPSRDRNKIYDLGICIEVESTRFLTTLSPVIDTLLPFSSENEDKVINHGVLAYKEKSPPSSSHRGLKASKLSLHKSPILIHGGNTPNLAARLGGAETKVATWDDLAFKLIILGWKTLIQGKDKTKITRKPSKTGKQRHEERKSTKEARKSSQRQDGQFNGSNTCWQSYTSSYSPHWSITSKNDTLAGVEAQRMMGFVLKALTEQTQTSQSWIATLAIRVSYEMIQGPRSTCQSLGRMKGRD
ncbi:hypothetical protein Tco_0811596 [Tanacetum coccineum]